MEDNFLNKPIGSHIDDDLTVENLRVLACDADINSLTYLCAVLVNCKYKVKHATSAAEAVGILNANKEGFDVVFVDVDTHSSDAFKLMETIRHEMRLPLIMVTGDVSPENKTKGLSHGAVDCIRKRPEKEEIMNTIRHHFTQDGPSEKDGKKKRMVWTPGLDAKFVKSVQTLEKKNMAHPMRILAMMNEQGLTRKHVASHLQKYRISLNKAKAAKMKEQGSPLEATSCRRRLEFENFNADLGLPVNEVHSLNSSLGPTMGDTAMPSSGSSSVPFQSHDLHNCLGGQTPDVFDNYLLETNVQPHNLEPEAVSGTTYQSQSPYLQGEGPVTILPSGPEFYVFPYKFLKRERIAAYRLPPAVSPVSYNLNGIANNVHYPVSTVNGVTEPSVGNGTTESPSGTSSRLNSEPNNQVSLFVDDPESPIGVTMLLDGIFCYSPVNVRYDDIANARYVHGLPVVEVHCMRCPSVLGEQYILRGQPGTVSPSPWEGPVILNHTALLYWNGSGFFFADDGTPLDD
ncbi:two-component response regulator ORR24-like [Hibiscus syriacus]|uniref:two-component response regulator ORR24-like n=1 Tax=Hibiscus syriacus TaxID=106335 RepID=UPI001920DC97|nr:two-component response regulator ORR24-like [Hibiscus syriacus]